MFLKNIFKICTEAFLLLILLSVEQNNAEFYSSIHEMSLLVEYEHNFLQNMQKFIVDNENKVEFLKARLLEFERERDEALEEGDAYFDSPVNKYMLTKRLTVDWERIENLMLHKTGEKFLTKIDKYKNKGNYPDNGDLDGAIEGFLRLQDVYRFPTKDMAAGILSGIKYATELEARHCYDIGKFALKQNQLRLAHSWLMEALVRVGDTTSNGADVELVQEPLDKWEILAALAEVKSKLLDIKGANETYTEIILSQPENAKITEAYTTFLETNEGTEFKGIDSIEDHEPLPDDLLTTDQHNRYKLTCSGHIKQTPTEERELRCGYLTETHPFLTIAPIKVEEMNHDPLLVVYYDVLSDGEIKIIKKLTEHKVQRATVMGQNGSVVSSVRTSQFVFMHKDVDKVLQNIDVRVQDMTNLNMDYAEAHQFANYGIGGHYAQHHDYFALDYVENSTVANLEMGNRIGTVLFYLTDVEQGGGTAYPYLKRLMLPKKGAAAFWYNLHASGEGDERTLHGACPIIVGSKWVQNRWIREFVQSDRRPCELFNDKVYGPF